MKHFKLIKPIWLAAMLLLSSVPLTANAYDFMVDGIPYNINGDSTSVTVTSRVPSPLNGGNYSVTTANIPSSVTYDGNTYSVTSIGSYAFYNCSGLTSVTIPSSVTNIGEGAFYRCSGLTSVDIPNSVTTIDQYAFWQCSGLTSVTIGNSVTSIGYAAFYNCSGLTRELVIPNSVSSIGDYAFSGCSGLTLVTIPNSVTSIGKGAFYGCSGLTSIYNRIDHPSDVTLGSNVFEYVNTTVCTLFVRRGRVDEYRNADQWKDFENIVEASVYDFMVDGIAYSFNDDGTSVTVTYTESWSTNNYSGLTTANIPSLVTYNGITYSVTSIGKGAFYGCSELTGALTIPNSVTTIGQQAFYSCSGLTSINIPNSVTSIGNYAFKGCSGLTSVSIPNSVTSIGDYAFSGCSGLTSVTIGNSVTSIGQQAFNECSDLTSVHITDLAAWCNIAFGSTVSNPLYFAHHLFLNGNEVKDLVIPNSVTSIGNYAFKGCSGLTSVSIPNSVTSIGDYAFSGCSGLTSIQNRINHPSDVTLGSNVFGYVDCTLYVRRGRVDEYRNADQWKNFKNIVETSVYDFMVDGIAYYFNDDDTSVTVTYTVLGSTNNYSGLTTANIPSSVTYNSITYSVTSIGQRAFYGCSGLTSVTIPNSVTSFGDYAFSGCSGLTSVTIPNSVTSIDESAFSRCSGLTSVIIGNSVTSIGSNAFSGCSGLTSVTIPNSVTTIGSSAFTSCTGLISVTIPNSVTSISDRTFNGCTGLTSITIPNSVTSIGDYAFYGNISLVSVTIPASVDSIGTQAFYVFDFGKNRILTLCGGVKYIGNDAFMSYRGGRNIHTLILKDSVVNIKNLGADPVQIYCYVPTPPECDENSFTRYDGTLHVPENTLVAYATADYWSNFTNLINDAVEPQSVTLNQTEAEIEPGNTLTLTATVFPSNATTNTVTWTTSNSAVATVTNNGLVTAVGFGECDITAKVLDKTAVCHVTVHEQQVIITLDNHELFVGVNKIAWLTPSMSPVSTDLAVQSSNTGVALAQLVNGRVRVIGVSPGVATVTVSSVDGMAQPDSCVVTVEPDFYYLTITIGGHVSVRQKVTPRGAYTYTLAPNDSGGNVKIVKFNGEDVTSQVSNGYYTTPAITQNSTLEITFE